MLLNTDEYLHFLSHLDLTKKQKEQFIKAVWALVESVIDEEFGLHPVQQIREKNANDNLHSVAKVIDSNAKPVNDQFNHRATIAGGNKHVR